jgi:hypothetical protein
MKASITAALSVEPPSPIPPAPAPVPAPIHTILPASAPANDVSTESRTFVSPAEQTMQRYQPALSHPPGPDSFPIDPITNFRSTYPTGFRGCMFCGSTHHVFRACSQHDAPGASDVFYRHLFAHKPYLRRRPPNASNLLPAPAAPAATLSFPVNPVLPPPPPIIVDPPHSSTPAPLSSALKRARFLVQIVKSFPTNIAVPHPTLPPMPIAIDNGLPHISFTIGSDHDSDPLLCGLMDTCGALNTGYLLFHQFVMSERPDLVTEYIEFDAGNPFEPIKLGGAIRDWFDFDASTHGNLTAVIRYRTPYQDQTGSPITFSFALGTDVTVNTIFGLPMLCNLDLVISLRANSLYSSVLDRQFPITRAAAVFGLPSGCIFDPPTSSQCYAAATLFSDSANPASAPLVSALAIAKDDTSLGFLRCSVAPTLL